MVLLQQLRDLPAAHLPLSERTPQKYWAGDHFQQKKCRARLSHNK